MRVRVSLTGEDVRLVINSRETVAQVFSFINFTAWNNLSFQAKRKLHEQEGVGEPGTQRWYFGGKLLGIVSLTSWQAVWETSIFLSRRQADIGRHRSALWLCHPMYHQRRPVWRHPGLKDQTQQLHRMRKARLDWSSLWSRFSDLIFFSKCGLQLWLN